MKVSKTFLLLVLSGLLFGYLMGVRTGFFRHGGQPSAVLRGAAAERDDWLNIYQGKQKTGYSHRRLVRRRNGFELTEETLMRLNTMGSVHTLHIRSSAALASDFSLSKIDFTLQSQQFSFHATGRVEGAQMVVAVDGRQPVRIPLDGPVYASDALLDAVNVADMKVGQTVRLPIFDPSSLGRQMVTIRSDGHDHIRVMGREVSALKLTLTVKGAEMSTWLDAKGRIVQESGFLGMSMKRVSKRMALDTTAMGGGKDLTREVSVDPGRIIADPRHLRELKVRVEGVDSALFLNGGRQKFDRGVLTIVKETVPDPKHIDLSGVRQYLKPTALMESDNPAIIRTAADITKPAVGLREKARRLVSWVYTHIEKKPVISVPNALQILTQRQGDCNEHAVLLAALARAAGIPAQVEAGLVYVRGRFYYHAWDVLYLGRWVTADALMNQMPADATHLRLVRGDLSRQMDILGAIGKIRLQVLETDGGGPRHDRAAGSS